MSCSTVSHAVPRGFQLDALHHVRPVLGPHSYQIISLQRLGCAKPGTKTRMGEEIQTACTWPPGICHNHCRVRFHELWRGVTIFVEANSAEPRQPYLGPRTV